MATTENEEVLTAEQRNLEYWNDMALKGAIYHQPEYKPSTPSQNQTGGTNHGSNGLRDEYDNPEDLYEDILLDLCGSLRDRPKLPVYFRPRNIRWSETDNTVSINRAERFFVPSDVDQTLFQQPCVQLPVQELLFYLSQISFFLRCIFFAHF